MAVGNKVKGITIEFNGETTKLGRAVNDINKKTRDLDNQLRSVDKAMKFNPGNTELVAQKQQLLGQKVDETKNKLTALREAQAKLDDDPAVDKTSQDYMELRREIIETESKLSHFEQQLKELNNIKFEQIGKKVEDIGNKMKTVGDNMTKYVTGPIVAAGAGSVKAFQEVDAGLDIVTQKTGATGKELENMHGIVKDLAGKVPADFETIGTAVGEVNTRFGLQGEALEDLSKKFIQFADLNGTDVNTAIDTVQKAMAAFGVSAEEAGPFLDRLNKVGQDTGVSMDRLAQAMVTNAPALQQMGFGADQAATFVGQLEKSGIDSQKAMAGMNKALVYSAKAGEPLPEMLSRFQDAANGAASEADVLAMASEMFGSKAGPQLAQAALNGSLDFAALAESAEGAAGSVENTFNNTLDPMDKFTMMMNDMKVVGYEVGATLLEAFGPTIEKLANGLKSLAEKWQGLSPGMQEVIVKAALVTAAVGPMISIFGRMLIGVGQLIAVGPKLISGFSAIGKAFGVLKTALLGNPWMLVAAAAIAAIVLIVKNWDKIKEFFSKLWEQVKEIFSAAWEAIKSALTAVWEGIKAGAQAIFEAIKAYFLFIFNVYKTIFTTAFNVIKKIVTTVFNGIKTFISNVINGWKTIISNGFNGIKNIASRIWNGIKNAIVKPIEKARDLIKKIVEKIKSFFNFDFKLPKIKLPHFSISPKGWKLGDLLEGSIPSLGIDWYAKGGIFRTPSVIGVGEKGPEAVLPIEKLNEMMIGMADSIVNGIGQTMALQAAGQGGEITIPIYLYPSGPKMGEETVKMYDTYKRILG